MGAEALLSNSLSHSASAAGIGEKQGPRALRRKDLRTHLQKVLHKKRTPQPKPTWVYLPTQNVALRQVRLALLLVRLGLQRWP